MLGAGALISTSRGSSAKISSLLVDATGTTNEIFENTFAEAVSASDDDLRDCSCRISAI